MLRLKRVRASWSLRRNGILRCEVGRSRLAPQAADLGGDDAEVVAVVVSPVRSDGLARPPGVLMFAPRDSFSWRFSQV